MRRLLSILTILTLFAALQNSASAYFADTDLIGKTYVSAVTEMVEKGVINGFPDGSFQPQETLTREQGAKIVTYMVLGDGVNRLICTSAPFEDVAADRWSAPCVAWCAEREILLGYGDGRFGPDDALTGDQFAKMLLCALGLARSDNYVGYGDSWTEAVRADAEKVGLYAGDSGMRTVLPITREQAALLAYNAVNAAVPRQDPPSETKPEPVSGTKPEPIEFPIVPVIPADPAPTDGPTDSPTDTTEKETPEIELPGDNPSPADPNPGESGGQANPGASDDGDILLPEVP